MTSNEHRSSPRRGYRGSEIMYKQLQFDGMSRMATVPDQKKRKKSCGRPVKKTKVEEVVQEDGDDTTRTVKCCLKKHLTDPESHMPVIEELVQHVSRITRHGSMFCNLFLLHVLRSCNGVIPSFVDVSNQNFFQRCMTVCCQPFAPLSNDAEVRLMTSFRNSAAISTVFDAVSHARRKGDTQLINEASRLYQTNFENHHAVPMFQRMKKYLRSRIGKRDWKELTTSDKYHITSFLWKPFQEFPKVATLQRHFQWIAELRNRYLDIQRRKARAQRWSVRFKAAVRASAQAADKEDVKEMRKAVLKSCERDYRSGLVEFTYWLGMRLHEHYEDASGEQPVGECDKPPPRQSSTGARKTFSIAPICDIGRQSIVLSKTVLQDLKNDFGIPKVFEDDPLEFVFQNKIHRLKSKANGWGIQGTVRTNGVSLSVVFQRPKKFAAAKTNGCERCVDDGQRIVAIDPGAINMYFGAERLDDGSVKTHKYTTKQFYHEAYVWRSKKRMDAKKRGCEDTLRRLSQCVKKTVVWDLQLEYWKAYAANWRQLFECLGCRMRSKLAMNVFIKGNRSIDRFLSGLRGTNQSPPPVIAYGAAKFSCTIKGTLSTPASRAFLKCKQRYRTVLVDEYNTSQYCPRCDAKLVTPKVPRMCRDGTTRMFDSRSVKRCTSPGCLRVATEHPLESVREVAVTHASYEMSRDKVGALNILRCATESVRPAHLCRCPTSQWHP